MIIVNHSVTARIGSGSATLEDLEKLVATAKQSGLAHNARVSFKYTPGQGQRDPASLELTVRAR